MIPGVPYDAEIEYLESTGTQWIDTGVSTATSGLKITSKLKLVEFVSYASIFGSYINEQSNTWRVIATASNNGYAYANCGYKASSSHVIQNFSVGNWHTVVMSGSDDTVVCDGVNWSKQSRKVSGNQNTRNILLFTVSSSPTPGGKRQIASFRIEQNDTLVRDFIPVRVGQTGYMYDRVTRRLFGNKDTGSFVLGPDVAKPVMGLWGMRKVYTADDYIKDGLVAMWDGIENAGRGQWGKNNPNATDWPALVGGNTWATGVGVVYDATSHYYDSNRKGKSEAMQFNLPSAMPLANSTVEIVINVNWGLTNGWKGAVIGTLDTGTQYNIVAGIPSSSSVTFYVPRSSRSFTTVMNRFHSVSGSINASGTTSQIYVDGTVKNTAGTTNPGNLAYINVPNISANNISMLLHSLRIYSRALSPAEIAHNYQIDKARFNLP